MTPSPAYQVLARRFRPASFGDVVGQEHVLATLRGCLEQERLPHAFLFSGSRGVGKTTTARILARAVNCEPSPGANPCGACFSCKSVLDGSASDVIELDAASNNGVDEVRALREQAAYAPLKLRRKVFILDEVHMFSRAAFNALLKILEEPPEHVLFILATTEAHKVPETVRSRCQVLPFRRIGEADIRARLQQICERESVEIDAPVLEEIAASSMGGLRDAETALERVLPLAAEIDLDGYRRLAGRLGPSRAAELIESCLAGDARAALGYAAEAVGTGVDERECLGEVLDVLRQVLLLLVDGTGSVLVEASGDWRARLVAIAERTDVARVDAMMQILVLARDRIRQMDDRRVLLELTLVRLARIGELMSLGELESRDGTAAAAAAAAPAPASPATPAVPSGPADPKVPAAPDFWVRSVETVLADRPALGGLLAHASLAWDGEHRLRLTWTGAKGLERDLLQAPATAGYLARVIGEHRGGPVEVEVEVENGSGAPAPRQQPRRATGVAREELPPLGRKAAELFEAGPAERDDTERS